jgi:hypothetical protein
MNLPTVHLNGTSKTMLQETFTNAAQALEAARSAVASTELHPRDFPLGGWEQARQEKTKQLQNIDEAAKWVEAHLEHFFSI